MTMIEAVRAAVEKTAAEIRDLEIALNLSTWNASTTGTEAALNAAAEAEAAMMRYFADPEAYRQYKSWDESGAAADDAHLARTVHGLHYVFAQGQRDPGTIDEMSALSKSLTDAHTNFRPEVGGKRLAANDIAEILRAETNSEVRREAWEASKMIGPRIAGDIRRMAELRNEAAQRMGYANYHQMSLILDELDPAWLFALLDELAAQTDEPFRQAKGELDAELSARYSVPVDELMPWHYADPFFQNAPVVGSVDLNALFEGKDLEALALKTYDGLGMDVRDIIGRSDLYEREGKDQHAFCMHVDREGDVRVLCNLKPTLRWMDTLLHELGHGVYDKYIPMELPWLLRSPAHILSTEAMALLMGAMPLDPEWHAEVVGTTPEEAQRIGAAGWQHDRLGALIFARWVMVMVNFERKLYEDPSQDLDAAWWELVQKYQLLNKPDGREKMPDWATKYHIALAPAYYQNYLLGNMMAIQWEGWLREHLGGIVGRPEAGEFFRTRVFDLGASKHWNDALEFATGEKLNPAYFAQKYAN